MKRLVPLLLAALAGTLVALASFVPWLVEPSNRVVTMFDVLAAIAFVLGAASLAKLHLAKVSAKRPGWGYSVVTLVGFVVMLVAGLLKIGVHPEPLTPEVAFSGDKEASGSLFNWLYDFAITPITGTLFAMLAFYVASAAFRAFRAKNLEAVLLLSTAFIILLGRTYAGAVLTDQLPPMISGLKLENLSVWIMKVFNTAGTRAIMIGIALGVAATSLRILLGLERSYLGANE